MADDPASFEELVNGLCGVPREYFGRVAFGYVVHDKPVIRVHAGGLPRPICDAAVRGLVTTLGTLIPTRTAKAGVVFPAARSGVRMAARPADEATGTAVCVAGVMPGGVASIGLFVPRDSETWDEAHAELNWLCDLLRRYVSPRQTEEEESLVYRVGDRGVSVRHPGPGRTIGFS